MEKVLVSNRTLTEIFWQKLRTYPECSTGFPVAIVPDRRFGWEALPAPYVVKRYPARAKRVKQTQNELRKIYGLKRR